MRRARTVFGVITLVGAAFGCTSAPGEEVAKSEQKQVDCSGVNESQMQCLADAQKRHADCTTQCDAELVKGIATDIASAFITGINPCMGNLVATRLIALCVEGQDGQSASLGNCVQTESGKIFDVIAAGAGAGEDILEWKKCVADLKDWEGLKAQWLDQARQSVYTTIAAVAARVYAASLCTNSCTDLHEAEMKGCEPVSCNRAKCTCFDAPSCPTISKCGGAETHQTGIVDCHTIEDGWAKDDNDEWVQCTSHWNQADKKCAGDTSQPACASDAGADAEASAW